MELPVHAAIRTLLNQCGVPPHLHSRVLWAVLAGMSLPWLVHRLAEPAKRNRGQPSTDFNSFLVSDSQPVKQVSGSRKLVPPTANNFNDFLRVGRPAPAATSFDAFLRSMNSGEAVSSPRAEDGDLTETGPRDEQVVVTILCGTEYGFAKEISEKLYGRLRDTATFWPRLVDMADVPEGLDLAAEQVLLVVCSTQGDGVPPSEAREFCDWLGSPHAPLLPHTSYSVCALGDTSYMHFCACGRQLDVRLAELGASSFVCRRDVNKEDWQAIDAWLQAVVNGLSLLKLQTVAELGGFAAAGAGQHSRIARNRPFQGTVVAVEGLCNIRSPDDKDTIRVEIDLDDSGLEYTPGDALGIYASNAPAVVEDLLNFLEADPNEMHDLPAWHYVDVQRPAGSQITLRDMLTHCYDLRSPKMELVQLLFECTPPARLLKAGMLALNGPKNGFANGHANGVLSNGTQGPSEQQQHEKCSAEDEHVKQLCELHSASQEELERYLDLRHVIDVLTDFDFARPPLEKLLRNLRPLQPRLYSISSSPLEAPCRVQVTIAVVRYTSLGRQRSGVASTFLAERIQVGECIPVYVSRNPDFRLPADPATPIIMVGPGTGLSPFRAFMMQRILSGAAFGTSWLFFGCRRRDQDFLYGSLLEAWASEGHIQLSTAFSRQQAEKVYVQDRLREAGRQIWTLLEAGAHFYVCGDAAHMAAAVEEALLEVIMRHQEGDKLAANEYVEALRSASRYQRDVWF